jgi:DMSO/TMAO reductase YedYZ molybdopterin-dependent catalytic subunit
MGNSDSKGQTDSKEKSRQRSLPPRQRPIKSILRWNIDHPGITPVNPTISHEQWTLTVSGEVENPIKLGWDDFMKLPAAESVSDFHCVEGWSVLDCRWYGVKFGTLAELVHMKEGAKYVFFKCADGYTTGLPLQDLLQDDVILAYKLNGEDLSVPLGGPMRLVVPEKYAYKSALWVTEINFIPEQRLGFWENLGYSETADVWKNDRYQRSRL